ncbi:30S ribosomal protein S6 [Candidatus Microgenomates bacterium]|nr:30S ribosomal protein S6 [Candidatus Microgenomates bacterium]
MTQNDTALVKNYELAVVLHPDGEVDLKGTLGKVESLVVQVGGKVTKQDVWDKQRLAYPVAGQQYGIYAFFGLALVPTAVTELEQLLSLQGEVLRHLLIIEPKPIEEVVVKPRRAAADAAVALAPAETDNKKSKEDK